MEALKRQIHGELRRENNLNAKQKQNRPKTWKVNFDNTVVEAGRSVGLQYNFENIRSAFAELS